MSKKHYLSIGTMFKNESWGLKEWIDHNKFHGVDHIYLINDFSEDDYLPILQPYIDEGYVTLFHNEVKDRFIGRQIVITNNYFLPIANDSQWFANIDVDEYLYSPKEIDLKKVLQKYTDYGRVITNWVWFNSNGFVNQPDGIVQNFIKRGEYNLEVMATLYSYYAENGQFEPELQRLSAPKAIVNTDFGVEQFNVHDILNGGPTINLSFKSNPEDPELLLNHYQ